MNNNSMMNPNNKQSISSHPSRHDQQVQEQRHPSLVSLMMSSNYYREQEEEYDGVNRNDRSRNIATAGYSMRALFAMHIGPTTMTTMSNLEILDMALAVSSASGEGPAATDIISSNSEGLTRYRFHQRLNHNARRGIFEGNSNDNDNEEGIESTTTTNNNNNSTTSNSSSRGKGKARRQ